MDKLRAMETFAAVAKTGSFAEAARKLKISAPSVTRLVSELETELGVMLVHRTTRQVVLTDIGQCYFRDVQNILSEMKSTEAAVRGSHQIPRGNLRITASSMFGQIYVTPIITQYLTEYPETSINAVFVDRVVNFLDEGIDVAVRIGELHDSSLIATRVGFIRPQICGSPNYFKTHQMPQTPDDLASHNTIGIQLGDLQETWRFANDKSFKPTHRLYFSTIPAAIAAARSGWGLVRVLSYQIGPCLKDGSLLSILQDFAPAPIPIHVVHSHGRKASAKIRAFVDMAVDTLRADPFLN